MNVLVLYAHPNPKSFCHAILEVAVKTFEGEGHSVHVRDLYALKFNPILDASDFMAFKEGKTPLDIASEQDEIRWSDVIVIVFPIWWASMPAILKGYFDRVFSYGFSFGKGPGGSVVGLLSGKKVYIFNTLGNTEDSYQNLGMFKSISQTMEEGVLKFSAMQVMGHKYFSSVPSLTHDQRQSMLEEVKSIVMDLSRP